MIEMTPATSMTDNELEAWFAAAGLNAEVVARCPDPTCELCAPTPLVVAA
jgi:hypothetical protein